MNRDYWQKLIESLPDDLTQSEAAKFLGKPDGAVRFWIMKLGYKFVDGRSKSWTESRRAERQKFDRGEIDWAQRNVEIAKKFGVSRERVRQIRKEMKLKKVNKQP